MRRLFVHPSRSSDNRPAVLSVVGLMMLLLPFLLLTSSIEKLAAIGLGLPGLNEDIPPEVVGPVESLRVRRTSTGFAITAAVRNTDIRASEGDIETRRFEADDLHALQAALSTLKRIDPDRTRATLIPQPDSSTEEIIRWIDAIRSGPDGDLFDRIILQGSAI